MPLLDSSPILLRSERLLIEIAAPGTVYHRTRFDWTGFITQVTLDGRHTFCTVEDLDPQKGSSGIGLCGEYGIEKSIGFTDAQPGEAFPKLGVGLLVRPDIGPYDFFYDYTILQPFTIHTERGEKYARFTADPILCRGYAARTVKTITVEGNELRIDYQLDNVGQKPIVTHEYCHNFVAVDGQPVGPGYTLKFPYTLSLEPLNPDQRESLPLLLDVNDNSIRWKAAPTKAFYCRPLGYTRTDSAQWEFVHEPTGVGMCEFDDFAPSRVGLWGTLHVISPEIFVDINVLPGESQSWSRRYAFFA